VIGKKPIANLEVEPLEAIASSQQVAALAVICGIEGPSYRPLGASMAIFEDGSTVGNLSSGCIEADIVHHAVAALSQGQPREIRYGRGSPFMDIRLPCGGGLDILIVPQPDREALQDVTLRHARRELCCLGIDIPTGKLHVRSDGETERAGTRFTIRIAPELRFLTFGAGPEAVTFAAIVQSIGFQNELFSPDSNTLEAAGRAGCRTHRLSRKAMPQNLSIDSRTAVTLFFHDHDWEPPILAAALSSPAFFVGAQGSKRAADARLLELEDLGMEASDRNRLRGPIGLIPSTRNAHTLAVSVLAEILAESGSVSN
jgi:xanthine dehydrogenase accessory factor